MNTSVLMWSKGQGDALDFMCFTDLAISTYGIGERSNSTDGGSILTIHDGSSKSRVLFLHAKESLK